MEHSDCYHCGEPGHFSAACPLHRRAESWDEHLARIDSFAARWADRRITLEQKRISISNENQLWHGEFCPRRLLYP